MRCGLECPQLHARTSLLSVRGISGWLHVELCKLLVCCYVERSRPYLGQESLNARDVLPLHELLVLLAEQSVRTTPFDPTAL